MAELISDPAQIDPGWMTDALRTAGLIDTARVTALTRTPVGNGLVADSVRFTLAYDHAEPQAPASVIGKFPAQDPASRRSGSDHLLYIREVSFYRDLAATLPIHTPHAIVTEIDPETDDFTLILTDLAPARQGDQLAGCSVNDAYTALTQAAALHAPHWNDPGLDAIDWLTTRPAALLAMVDAALPMVITLFKDRYAGVLEPEWLAMVDRLPMALNAGRTDNSSPRTLIHGDFRLDNILFDVNAGAHPMATLDWQTITVGPGAVDVAYFLSAGLDPATRRANEPALLRHYHAELVRRGVTDYSHDACWRDYTRNTIHGILMGVFSALSVERTPRGDALFLKMTRGACQQAADHNSFDLL